MIIESSALLLDLLAVLHPTQVFPEPLFDSPEILTRKRRGVEEAGGAPYLNQVERIDNSVAAAGRDSMDSWEYSRFGFIRAAGVTNQARR